MARSTLFENGTVISFDDATQNLKVLRNTSVLVTGDKIAAIFDSNSPDSATIPPDAEKVDASTKIISPGFVDTHRHGWQTAFKTIAPNTTLAEYMLRYGQFGQARTVFTPDDIYYGQLAGIYESLNAGVTSILDHAHGTFTPEASAAALNASIDSGARVWWCYGFGAFDEKSIEDFRNQSENERLKGQSLVQYGMGYDGWGHASAEEAQAVIKLAKETNIAALTTHHLGGPWLFDNGPSTITRHAPDLLATSPFPIIFSHASFLTPADAQLLRAHPQHTVSITPESEMHYGHDHPSTPHLHSQASLGIDTHFTFAADILTQARLWLQATRRTFFSRTLAGWRIPRTNPMAVADAFLLATRNGGRALGRADDVGVVRVGAVADLVLFDGTSPNMLGWADPVAAVVLHANVGDVKDVLVGGEWRKRDGVLVAREGVDRKAVEERFLESARRVQKVWEETEWDTAAALQGEWQPGVSYADTERPEDAVRRQ